RRSHRRQSAPAGPVGKSYLGELVIRKDSRALGLTVKAKTANGVMFTSCTTKVELTPFCLPPPAVYAAARATRPARAACTIRYICVTLQLHAGHRTCHPTKPPR